MEFKKALQASPPPPSPPPPPPPTPPPPTPSSPPPCPCHQKESVLMEVMGDSEMDINLPQTCQYCMPRMMEVEVEEDAESCCGKFEGEREFDYGDVVDDDDDDDDDGGGGGGGGGFRQLWRSWRQDGVVVNSAEENRLFWLNCLADHGFP